MQVVVAEVVEALVEDDNNIIRILPWYQCYEKEV